MTCISIVIPTYNRPAGLAACLESLALQTYPLKNIEVIVVDDGGSVNLEPVIRPFLDKPGVRFLRQNNTGPAGARNAGVSHASGEFISFVDDDCVLPEDWLATLIPHLKADPSKMYGGYTANMLGDNIYSVTSQLLIDYLYEYYNTDPGQARFLASNNMSMSRDLFVAAGGFDADFPGASGEDRELCDRWLDLGHFICYVPDVRVLHGHQLNFRSFCRQHYNYGTGAIRFWQRKSERQQVKFRIEPTTFYTGLMSYAWTKKLSRPVPVSFLMMISQVANAMGFIYTKISK